MKKMNTLKKNYEYKIALNKGEFYVGRQILCRISQNKKERKNQNYLGIAISTKIGKATKRNRIKRLIRENYRLLQNNIIPGNTIVFLWIKRIKPELANFHIIQEDMIKIFKEAGIWKEEK